MTDPKTCSRCDTPITHKHGGLCLACIADDMDYDDGVDCANCGGEGFTYGCSWDWQCDTYDEGEGTCLCTRRCEWCNPLTAEETAERNKLRAVLAHALANDTPEVRHG